MQLIYNKAELLKHGRKIVISFITSLISSCSVTLRHFQSGAEQERLYSILVRKQYK
jgi:hypothetical protein